MSEATVGTDLLARLRAAIDETERMARAAMEPANDDGVWKRGGLSHDSARVAGLGIVIYDEGGHDMDQAEHIARHDPASVLRRCAADRKILELHPSAQEEIGWTEEITICYTCRYDNGLDSYSFPCPTIVALAAGYGIEDVNG